MAEECDVWLISGCSSGVGAALAKQVYDAGCCIIATARKAETLSYLPDGPKVLKLALDVTSKDQVTKVLATAVEKFGHLDVVVNNAGYGLIGDTEGLSDEDARAQLETNFWGATNVTKAALPILREVNAAGKGGLIIQMSSIGGRVAFPGSAFYEASKFALEGYTEALSKEMLPAWNIKFLIIDLGNIKTSFVGGMHIAARHPAYQDPLCPYNILLAYMTTEGSQKYWSDAAVCARVLYEVAADRKHHPPPLRLALGADAYSVIKSAMEETMEEHEEWRAISESISHADNAGATDAMMAMRRGF